jgi:plasmid stabilization system protein ParE
MTVNYTPRSKADLNGLAEYYDNIDLKIFPRILDEILSVLARVELQPWSGKTQHVKYVRKVVATKYGYIIYYKYHARIKTVDVLRIVHGRQRRPFKDS